MSTERVTITGIILGQRVENVLHFNNPDGSLSAAEIASELSANWMGPIRNLQNNALSYTQIAVQRVFPFGSRFEFPVSPGTNGALFGAPAATVLCGLFSIRTATAGRHGHGRFYMFGVHGESVENSVIQAGAYAAYVGVANNLTARYGASGTGPITLVVCPRNSPGDTHTCTAIIVRRQFGIQRRRNIGVGG